MDRSPQDITEVFNNMKIWNLKQFYDLIKSRAYSDHWMTYTQTAIGSQQKETSIQTKIMTTTPNLDSKSYYDSENKKCSDQFLSTISRVQILNNFIYDDDAVVDGGETTSPNCSHKRAYCSSSRRYEHG
jgi:outer membrane cobalamin receptor